MPEIVAVPVYTNQELAEMANQASADMKRLKSELQRIGALPETHYAFNSPRSKELWPPHGGYSPESSVVKKEKLAKLQTEYDGAFLRWNFARRELGLPT